MKKIFYILIAVFIIASISYGKDAKLTRKIVTGKRQAPIAIEYEVFETRSIVKITFNSDAEDVNVIVKGVDNITISTPSNIVSGESFNKGETRDVDVEFSKKNGRSYIAFIINGKFNGMQMHKIVNIQIGKQTKEKKIEMMKQLKTGRDGRNVIIYDLK